MGCDVRGTGREGGEGDAMAEVFQLEEVVIEAHSNRTGTGMQEEHQGCKRSNRDARGAPGMQEEHQGCKRSTRVIRDVRGAPG